MKYSLSLTGGLAAAMLALTPQINAQSVATDPVGYVTLTLKGHNNETTSALTFTSISLVGPIEYTSTTSSFSSGDNNVLSDTSALFSDGEYMNGSEISHYLEITSGTEAGTMTLITGCPGGTSLYTNDDLSHIPENSSYIIRKSRTISDLFGENPTSITGSNNISSADEVLLLNAATGVYTSFWYSTDTAFGKTPGWKSTDNTISSPADYALYPTDGILINRKQASDSTLTVTGAVKTSESRTLVSGGGFNILAVLIPTDQLTLSNSGLYSGDDSTGIQGNNNISSADEILIYNSETKTYTSFWYSTDTAFGKTPGWKSTDSSILDVPNYILPANTAILINRKSDTDFTWSMPKVNLSASN